MSALIVTHKLTAHESDAADYASSVLVHLRNGYPYLANDELVKASRLCSRLRRPLVKERADILISALTTLVAEVTR